MGKGARGQRKASFLIERPCDSRFAADSGREKETEVRQADVRKGERKAAG